MLKRILKKLWMRFLKNISRFGVEFLFDPPGAVRFFIEPRIPTKNQSIENKTNVALVFYKIASVLPEQNTISFDFLKDWKVWFWIVNHETKKYKAYIKIKFISDDYKKELNEGYYGGTRAWNLNALIGIRAPGLGIPKEIREKAKQRKKIEIRISCEIKDKNDELIEQKLPIGYVYDYENNSWYYEP